MDRHSDVVINESGRAVAGASVLILDANGQAATIYADRSGNVQANPIATDTLGRWSFCAADGIYSAQVSLGGVIKYTLKDIRLNDPADDFAPLATTAGAGMIGTSDGATVQQKLIANAAFQTLLGGTTGAAQIGATGGTNVQAALDALNTTVAGLHNYTLPAATSSVLGGVKVGTGLSVDGAGLLSVSYSYTLPIAGASTLGGIKVGSGLAIDGAGVLSATGVTSGSVASVNSVTPVSGNVSLNTDNLPESGTPTNQWFTAARVRAVVLTGLSTATNAVIAATDTILAAFGKLQAQVSANSTSITSNTSAISANTTAIAGKQDTSAKDATGGYAGLTLFKINFKNAANTFTSFFTNTNTAVRTYTFPDKDMTVAGTVDVKWDLIGTATVSSAVANIDFLTLFSDTYNKYVIEIEAVSPSAGDSLAMQFAYGGTLATGSTDYFNQGRSGAGAASNAAALGSVALSAAGQTTTVTTEIRDARSSNSIKVFTAFGGGSAGPAWQQGSHTNSTGAISGFRLFWGSGSNFTAGTVRVYGIKSA